MKDWMNEYEWVLILGIYYGVPEREEKEILQLAPKVMLPLERF